MKKHLTTILLVLVFLLGVGVMLYPSVSDAVNRAHQSRVLEDYTQITAQMTKEANEEMLRKAQSYNDQIRQDAKAILHPEEYPQYESLLDPNGIGVMGSISIPKISTTLPIYHGTDEAVLQKGVGHLEGTSLPIGGQGTHAVLSAHRGLPSAMLFTKLDELEVGDTFQIQVLDRTLNYQVDKISIVLPHEIDLLAIDPEEDFVTLMTCTPYGINSHRLLVRGCRIADDARQIVVSSEAARVEPMAVAAVLFLPILLIFLLIPKGRRHGNA